MTAPARPASRVLHAIVGHKLPEYFLNAVDSVLRLAPDDDLLVVDNGSQLDALTGELTRRAQLSSRVRVISRAGNDLSRNRKVGGLYDAYADVLDVALSEDYDLLHLMQHDMQMIWWDPRAVGMAMSLFDSHPNCVNVVTAALARQVVSSDIADATADGDWELPRYGLTDTGFIHLGRWRDRGMRFMDSETEHSRRYRREGLQVFLHPLPCVAPIPWPAVVRDGRVRGTPVRRPHALLLRPLGPVEVDDHVADGEIAWLEDLAFPWGWRALTPMWPTALESIDYWVYAYREMRTRGLRDGRPRWTSAAAGARAAPGDRRPAPWEVLTLPAWHEVRRRASAVIGRSSGRRQR